MKSFSIIYETENLSSVELHNIFRSLNTIKNQSVSPDQSNEFLIIDGGYAPENLVEELTEKYSWITVKRIEGVSYHEAKWRGISYATGEIVIMMDSDCEYSCDWIKNVLELFESCPDINVVSGEVSTLVRNPFELAIAMHYFFPRFSNEDSPYISNRYFFNSVAFRREFVQENPFSIAPDLYRGSCTLHAHELCNIKKHSIWMHPKAKALHEPPELSFTFWRYLLKGRDRLVLKHKAKQISSNGYIDSDDLYNRSSLTTGQKLYEIGALFRRFSPFNRQRISSVLSEEKSSFISIVVAFIYMIWFETLSLFGSLITVISPNLLLNSYKKRLIKIVDNDALSSEKYTTGQTTI